MALWNQSKNELVVRKVILCRNFWSRLRGLLGTEPLAQDAACWIEPCNAIHTFGMRYSVDVFFLDARGKVVGIKQNMKPNRLSRIYFGARVALEMVARKPQKNIHVGDCLTLVTER